MNVNYSYRNNNSSNNIGFDFWGFFCGLLTIAFIVLKLTGFIDWSWLWVLAPIWIPVAFYLVLLLIILIIVLVRKLFNK